MPKSSSRPSYPDIFPDLTPIPLSDDMTLDRSFDASPIQPLATIAYPPAYLEATSYLRAVMARNEFSPSALDLTDDVISMNPAHYTVWLYRMKILRALHEGQAGAAEEEVEAWVTEELRWLEGVSRRNLKNYQIWHHRQSLVGLLPHPPTDEISFLTDFLSLDTKNYHVWSYRQWLCARFPADLLFDGAQSELCRVEEMLEDDVLNNSAWNHRWFVVFGAEDLRVAESNIGRQDGTGGMGGLKGLGMTTRVVDEDVVDREIGFARTKIELAPNNLSAWNYLKGVLRRAGRERQEMEGFCLRFVGEGGNVEVKHDTTIRGVRSTHAVEWLGEIWGARGEMEKSRSCFDVLGRKWDPIRRNYWNYRIRRLNEDASLGEQE